MRKKFLGSFLITLCAAAVILLYAAAFPPAPVHGQSQIIKLNINGAEVGVADQGVSIPVRDMPTTSGGSKLDKHEKPLHMPNQGQGPSTQKDPVVQSTQGPLVATTTPTNFAGLGDGENSFTVNAAPPDTNGAVGATQYVQWVNESFAVFNKSTGGLMKGPVAGNQLFQALGPNHACAINNDGDPIAQYDKAANRWVLTQFSVTNGKRLGYYQCVAVSQTSDATGAYNVYAFNQPSFNDYPKLGVWPDAYYTTFNMFKGRFSGARACAFDRNAMLKGATATQICFQQNSSVASLLPSDLDGATAPPSGSPNFLLNFGNNLLNLYKFHVDFANPNNSTFTGPTVISVAPFNAACNGGGNCIPQPQTSQLLDSLADRLMYRLAYRHFASDGHESLVVNHSVTPGNGAASGVRFYELRSPGTGSFSLYQQGTFSPDSTSRWMGSAAMDKLGDIAVGYSISSSSIFPSIAITGRTPADSLGSLEAENVVFSGTGSQLPTLARWGDYSAMSVDPVDDCTFYYTNEYIPTNGTFNWRTRVITFKFTGCQ